MAKTTQTSSWMATTLYSILCCLLINNIFAVSRDNFKSCDQSGFCKRHRAVPSGESPYVILMDSLKIQSTNVQVQLLNTKNNVRLLLELYGLQENTARLKINELNPIKPRFEIPIGDVLVGEPKQQGVKLIDKNDQSVTFGLENNKIVLTSSPFRVDFFTEGDHVVGVNAQGLLKFEHLRTKPEPKPAETNNDEKPEDEENKDDDDEDEEEAKEEKVVAETQDGQDEEPDMWGESFKGFADSKPNGPASVGMDIGFPGFEHVYGIPEHAETLALKSTKDTDPYRLFNLDVFEYELYNPMALYGSVPMMIAHNEKRTVGIYWNNAAETWIDIRSNVADKTFLSKVADLVKGSSDIPQTDTHWFSESGIIDLFIMMGPSPKQVFRQYAILTGTTPLPPLFAISYQQCRWNYNDQDDVKNVDANMDKFQIPYDVIWLDIEHTDGKRYFTWDKDKFSHPEDMINNVASRGRKMVTIVDPHLKKDDNFGVYADCKNHDLTVKNKDGGEYEGWCWPGSSIWPDFLNPAIRKWWASKFAYDQYKGSTPDLYIWNDMNEPSVFNGPEITFHKDVKHFGGWENRDIHNLYGMYVHHATGEGIKFRSNNEQRPFVLSRAFFAGSQRSGAVWTGDNMGEWSHLKISNPMILSLNLVGITFSGADVGGFFRNPEPELIARWYQAAAFQPFFRAHAHLDTKRREPYLLDERLMKVSRDAIRTRYTFLPYWYTLYYFGERDGGPLMMPLWVEYPEDKSTFQMDDQYLLGSYLLVKPITEAGGTGTTVYFPGQNEVWYDILTLEKFNGGASTYVNAALEKIPVFQRGGSIIPRKMRSRRSSGLMHNDPFTFIVCLDQKGQAAGDIYVDEYDSFRYQSGKFILKKLTFKNNVFESSTADPNGTLETKEWIERIVIVGYSQKPKAATLKSGKNTIMSLDTVYDSKTKTVTVRKPAINIAEDFTIQLS
ncbi:neutral alpha-glucosidase AB-like isoform X2 [Argopecten irradians]|uniref:neutral alpha-glucosidase AB-like isoform X2 n=1 Tax=Argopecten irradians TaxID=31199 RepID=UPI0037198AE0